MSSSVKKFMGFLFGVIGVLAIATCVALAIKLPQTYNTLGKELGIVNQEVDIDSDKVLTLSPTYVMNFSTITNDGSGYKSSYFHGTQNRQQWYCSSGNGANPNMKPALDFMLGWNDISSVTGGTYDFYNSISPLVDMEKQNEGYKFAYLLMDFDLWQNHTITFQLAPHFAMKDTTLQIISSRDSGSNWKIEKEISNEILDSDKDFSVELESTTLKTTYRRYGLLLTSNQESCRLEVKNFVADLLV